MSVSKFLFHFILRNLNNNITKTTVFKCFGNFLKSCNNIIYFSYLRCSNSIYNYFRNCIGLKI